MRIHTVRAEITLPVDRSSAFAFFGAARNLERLTPPDLRFVVTQEPDAITEGCLIDYRLRLDGIPFGWRTRISLWQVDVAFIDEQLRGPYRQWIHRHDFEDHSSGGTLIRDRVDLILPFQPIGEIAWPYVRRKVRRIFEFRQRAVAAAFNARIEDCASQVTIDATM